MTQPQLKIQATLERRRHQDNVVGPGDSNLHTYSRDNLSRVVIGSIDMATEKAQLVGRQEVTLLAAEYVNNRPCALGSTKDSALQQQSKELTAQS